jgi:hypothetical protein
MLDATKRARPADLVEKRKPLARKEFLQLCIDQNGRCGCGCGVKLDPMGEGVIDEHYIPLELTGPNALRNRMLFRKPCAKAKTKIDAGTIAKAKRLAGETCTAPPARPLRGRGFDHTMTRGFDGKVRPRKSRPTREASHD